MGSNHQHGSCNGPEKAPTDVKFVSSRNQPGFEVREDWCSPFVVYGFDDEPECGAHGMNVFIHDLLDYGRFPCVIQSTLTSSVSASLSQGTQSSYSINILISLSFKRAFRRMESIVTTFRFCCG